eukprot:m.29413 g.29413  ORF g.29413 m.29413 type:complete len:523 (+) comp31166_c0_seq3:190-1758(+)
MDLKSPDDWNVSELKDLDHSLRCSICFEYFRTAMMLSCSHNFCSLCIRRHIEFTGNKSNCPLCGEPAVASNLTNNRLIDQVARQFTAARQFLMKKDGQKSGLRKKAKKGSDKTDLRLSSKTLSSNEKERSPPPVTAISLLESIDKTKLGSGSKVDIPGNISPEQENLPAMAVPVPVFTIEPSDDEGKESAGCSSHSPSKSSSLPERQNHTVACPACGAAVSAFHINAHLDRCLDERRVTERAMQQSQRKANHRLKRLPKLVYTPALLSDKALNKKLVEVGLPTTGNRQTKIKRHRDFTIAYNAELDHENPRSLQRLVKEFMKTEAAKSAAEEKTESAELNPCESDKVREEYLSKHNASFKKLIKNMKKRRKKLAISEEDDNEEELESKDTTAVANSTSDDSLQTISAEEDDLLGSPSIFESKSNGNLFSGQHLLKEIPPTNLTQIIDDELNTLPETVEITMISESPNVPDLVEREGNKSEDDFCTEPEPKRRKSLRSRQSLRKPTRYSPLDKNESSHFSKLV